MGFEKRCVIMATIMQTNIYDLIITGAGASGLMAAQEAGRLGLKVLVLEGKASAGAKILMSGGTRCNVTNAFVSEKDYMSEYPRLVRHVLQAFRPEETVLFFEDRGVHLRREEDGKYFPESDSAKDVLKALLGAVKDAGVTVQYEALVRKVENGGGLWHVSGEDFEHKAKVILIATGGLSYPGTGTNGFGYKIARIFGTKASVIS